MTDIGVERKKSRSFLLHRADAPNTESQGAVIFGGDVRDCPRCIRNHGGTSASSTQEGQKAGTNIEKKDLPEKAHNENFR